MLKHESLKMDKEKFIASGLLHQYALGLTDPEEEQVVENFLSAYPELKDEVLRAQRSVRQLALNHGIHPSPAHKTPSEPRTVSNLPTTRRPINHAVIAAFLGILALWYFQSRRTAMHHANQLQAVLENCEKDSEPNRHAAVHLFHPDTRIVVFQGNSLKNAHSPIVFWNAHTRTAYCYPASLPALSADSCYQLWAEVNGQMIRLAVLKSAALQAVEFADKAQNLHITSNPVQSISSSAVQKPIATAPL